MGSGIDNHSLSHHHHHFLRHKSIFLPMLCRLSLKDIKLNRRRRDPTISDEPSSPKVSCMGQVKRNNRITAAGLPPSAAASPTTHYHKYSKLKKLFSSRALLAPATTSAGRSKSCRGVNNDLRRLDLKKERVQEYVDVGELDPPLPVVKRAAPPPGDGGDGVNLWKRRFDGAALKTLQIQQINLQNCNVKPPTV